MRLQCAKLRSWKCRNFQTCWDGCSRTFLSARPDGQGFRPPLHSRLTPSAIPSFEGGGLAATSESAVEVHGRATIEGNSAWDGGGLDLSSSRQTDPYLFLRPKPSHLNQPCRTTRSQLSSFGLANSGREALLRPVNPAPFPFLWRHSLVTPLVASFEL